LETRRAILSNDLQSDSRFDASQSIMSGWLRSVMCVPICRADGGVLGVVQLDAKARGRGEFRGRDLEVLAGIAGAAAQAVEQALAHDERLLQAKLNRDLELAGDVQKALLPSKPPEIPGYEVFDFYEPARHVGGDYFNYVPLPDGRIAVVMADVSGKGVPAAMVMAVLSGDVKYCLAAEPDLVRAVTRINDSVCRSGWDERFATFVAAVLDPRTHRATLVNAGHLPAYVRDSAGGVTAIGPEQGGLPLGLAAEWEYRASEISIEPGMTLVFFTDGISEAMDVEDRLYGLERIEAQVGKPGGSPEEVGRRILADVERHTAGQIRSDDMCLVCVGRQDAAAEQPQAFRPRKSLSRSTVESPFFPLRRGAVTHRFGRGILPAEPPPLPPLRPRPPARRGLPPPPSPRMPEIRSRIAAARSKSSSAAACIMSASSCSRISAACRRPSSPCPTASKARARADDSASIPERISLRTVSGVIPWRVL
jgi:serine phosphatase RsbU (regulator of sigma subunit)